MVTMEELPLIPILDFQERALTGPVMKTTKFDIAFSKKLREVVTKYEIEMDLDQIVVDEKTADAVFSAGVELLAATGVYHLDTQRVIEFSEEEIYQLAAEHRANPRTAVLGQGEDRLEVRYREADDKHPPICATGPSGPIEQEWYVPFARSLAKEPRVKAFGISGGLAQVNGVAPKAGTLSEMYCAQWETEQLLHAIEAEGRPGMHLGLLSTASTVGATMACIRPGLRSPHNTQIGIHIIPEQKLDWARLVLAKYCEDSGIVPWTSCASVIGAISRNGADAAVAVTANLLAQLAYGHGSLASIFVNQISGMHGDPECLWAFSAACLAATRHLRVPIAAVCAGNLIYGRTAACMYPAAAAALSATASGFSYVWIGGGSGLEARGIDDVMRAASGMSRDRANELLRAILAKGEEVIPESKGLQHLPAVYDLERIEPKPEYRDECQRVADGLVALGVPIR